MTGKWPGIIFDDENCHSVLNSYKNFIGVYGLKTEDIVYYSNLNQGGPGIIKYVLTYSVMPLNK